MTTSLTLDNGATGYFISTPKGYCTFKSTTPLSEVISLIKQLEEMSNA